MSGKVFSSFAFLCIIIMSFSIIIIDHLCVLLNSTDTEEEIALIKAKAIEAGAADAVVCSHWADGGLCLQLYYY